MSTTNNQPDFQVTPPNQSAIEDPNDQSDNSETTVTGNTEGYTNVQEMVAQLRRYQLPDNDEDATLDAPHTVVEHERHEPHESPRGTDWSQRNGYHPEEAGNAERRSSATQPTGEHEFDFGFGGFPVPQPSQESGAVLIESRDFAHRLCARARTDILQACSNEVTGTTQRLHAKWQQVDLHMGGFVVLPLGILRVLLDSAVQDLEFLGIPGWMDRHTRARRGW